MDYLAGNVQLVIAIFDLNFYKYLNNFRKNYDENMKKTIYK